MKVKLGSSKNGTNSLIRGAPHSIVLNQNVRLIHEDASKEVTPEQSRKAYKEWVKDPNRILHPNVNHNPTICHGCLASYENCICENGQK
jgi:hypothetical protein